MIFNANSYKLIPNVKNLNFAFNNINLVGTGVAQVGFSGASNYKFTFARNRIFDNDGKFVGVYDENHHASITGGIHTGNCHYYINNDLIVAKSSLTNQNYLKFFVNVTGAELSIDPYLSTNDIPYSVTIPTGFFGGSGITGYFANNSTDNPIYIYNIFWQSYNSDENFFSGSFSGAINSGTGVSFALYDASQNLLDDDLQFLLGFNTSIGALTGIYESSRVSGLSPIKYSLVNDYDNRISNILFDGSGVPINYFTYLNTPVSELFTFEVFASNLKGESKSKSVVIGFDPVSPLSGAYYQSNYVTGFSLTSSGEYLYPPTAKFSGYYYVSGMTYDLNTLLLNSGCSGNVTVIFTGVGQGDKGSGVLNTSKVYLKDVYNAGTHYYYTPTSFTMVTGGTGYITSPQGLLQTGVYGSQCYDVAAVKGYNYLIYSPFNGYGDLSPHADYLTGVVLTTTGLVNGGSQTGYLVTGLDITNPGFGYNINAFPKMSFIRSGLDGLTKNATGNFSIKQSGIYDFTGHWSIKTGVSNASLAIMSLPSGTAYLAQDQNFITVQVNMSGKDHTEPMVGKLSLYSQDGQSVYNLVSGIREYDYTTGFLKKKNILESLRIPAGSELPFTLTQEELDNYYSSSDYLNQEGISLGDLDF